MSGNATCVIHGASFLAPSHFHPTRAPYTHVSWRDTNSWNGCSNSSRRRHHNKGRIVQTPPPSLTSFECSEHTSNSKTSPSQMGQRAFPSARALRLLYSGSPGRPTYSTSTNGDGMPFAVFRWRPQISCSTRANPCLKSNKSAGHGQTKNPYARSKTAYSQPPPGGNAAPYLDPYGHGRPRAKLLGRVARRVVRVELSRRDPHVRRLEHVPGRPQLHQAVRCRKFCTL
jgi:hypothetical protein